MYHLSETTRTRVRSKESATQNRRQLNTWHCMMLIGRCTIVLICFSMLTCFVKEGKLVKQGENICINHLGNAGALKLKSGQILDYVCFHALLSSLFGRENNKS